MVSKFDVIIFGASGCVGKHVVFEAIHVLEGLTWAIAGRSKEKLKQVLAKISQKTTKDLSHIPIIIADANNPGSIENMVEKCDVLINCCGPYQLWAELIINICIIAGTHYVDMCNDPYFNELMEIRYHSLAREYNVYVISSCGFQSFPVEIALNLIRKQFDGTINHVDAYAIYNFDDCCLPICPLFTDTTWFSVIWSFALAGEISWLREELREKPLPNLIPKQPLKDIFHKLYSDDNSIFLRFPFTDLQFVERSQYQFYAEEGERPIQFYKYVAFPLFSMGVCSPDGPDEYTIQASSYKIILLAEGWSKSVVVPSLGPFDGHMRFQISGFNPIYGCGCLGLLLASCCLVQERDKLPGGGGVYSPGYAFDKSNILEKLQLYPGYFSVQIL